MGVKEEVVECYTKRKQPPKNVVAKYINKLNNKEERGLFKATVNLFSAYCAAPSFNKTKQLDILAENNEDMQNLRVLIRNYGKGVEEILGVYDEYFSIEYKMDFWAFFDTKLELPNGWLKKHKKGDSK